MKTGPLNTIIVIVLVITAFGHMGMNYSKFDAGEMSLMQWLFLPAVTLALALFFWAVPRQRKEGNEA